MLYPTLGGGGLQEVLTLDFPIFVARCQIRPMLNYISPNVRAYLIECVHNVTYIDYIDYTYLTDVSNKWILVPPKNRSHV